MHLISDGLQNLLHIRRCWDSRPAATTGGVGGSAVAELYPGLHHRLWITLVHWNLVWTESKLGPVSGGVLSVCLSVTPTIPVSPTVKQLSAVLSLSGTLKFFTFSM